jgi:hypothetical protein
MSMQNFLDAPNRDRRLYSLAFMEGLGVAAAMGSPEEPVGLLFNCTKPMSLEQISAIFDKHGTDYPQQWHRPFGVEALTALEGACPQLKAWDDKRWPKK